MSEHAWPREGETWAPMLPWPDDIVPSGYPMLETRRGRLRCWERAYGNPGKAKSTSTRRQYGSEPVRIVAVGAELRVPRAATDGVADKRRSPCLGARSMTLPCVEEMISQPVVGRLYWVRCLRWNRAWWPVTGPVHEDADLGVVHLHLHYDARFLTVKQIRSRDRQRTSRVPPVHRVGTRGRGILRRRGGGADARGGPRVWPHRHAPATPRRGRRVHVDARATSRGARLDPRTVPGGFASHGRERTQQRRVRRA